LLAFLHLHSPFNRVAGLFQVLLLPSLHPQPGAQQFLDSVLPGRAPNIERFEHGIDINLARDRAGDWPQILRPRLVESGAILRIVLKMPCIRFSTKNVPTYTQ
jgi:hypothetical protein